MGKKIGNWIFEGGSRWGVREYEFTELGEREDREEEVERNFEVAVEEGIKK